MSTTARLNLPYIAPLQAQKQVTYNEAMAALDQLVQPAVKSRTTTVPPVSPAEGDTYIVAPAATGEWAGRDGAFACRLGGTWSYRSPAEGWLAFVADAAELAVYHAGAWASFASNGGTTLARLGVNATADLTNRLSVAADATLLSHDGAGHQLKINKAGIGDTASLLYQNGFSGRAELGLAGDDAFHVKVSPDGSSWYEALTVAPDSGLVSLPLGQLAFPAVSNPSADAKTLDDYEEGIWTPGLAFGGASTGIVYGSQTHGRYTKIGRTVFVSATLVLSNRGSATGAAMLTGLPFTSADDGVYVSAAIGYAGGLSGVSGAVIAMMAPNASRYGLYQSANGGATALTNTNFSNATQIFLSGTFDV